MSETVRGRRKNGRRGEKKPDLGNGLKMVSTWSLSVERGEY